GSGGAGGSGGEPAHLDAIYVQGGCICGVTGRSAPSSKPSWALGLLAAALGTLTARRASGRRTRAQRLTDG
ncbi:MAG TPA: hypothetical protein VE093_33010, partial [Polyangiaceae bacterium]|nr:hypothetical protein [Polyangiaceae bacterium]